MTAPITFTVQRSMLINANHRLHWSTRAKRTKYLRTAAGWASAGTRVTGKVRVLVRFTYPTRTRPKDEGNLHPTAKAILDGMVDAKVFPDDSIEYVEGPDVRVDPNPDPWLRSDLGPLVRVAVTWEPS